MSNQDSIQKDNRSIINEQAVDPEDLKQKINDMYTDVALDPHGDYHFKMGRDLAEILGYSPEILDDIPDQSIDSFAGVGYFFDLAELEPGEKVLDLGSGSGMDAFFAGQKVDQSGKVVGIDMNEDQLAKAIKMRDTNGIDNIEFMKGDIEDLPFEDNSFNIVISNGVFNLIPNKVHLFREISRILKPSGRLVFSDIVTDSQLPENVKCDSTLWASCIGGAEQRDNYIQMIENAGMRVEKSKHHERYGFKSDQANNASEKWGVKSYSFMCVMR